MANSLYTRHSQENPPESNQAISFQKSVWTCSVATWASAVESPAHFRAHISFPLWELLAKCVFGLPPHFTQSSKSQQKKTGRKNKTKKSAALSPPCPPSFNFILLRHPFLVSASSFSQFSLFTHWGPIWVRSPLIPQGLPLLCCPSWADGAGAAQGERAATLRSAKLCPAHRNPDLHLRASAKL